MAKLLREPLFHFCLIGVGIFFWFAYTNPLAAISQPPDTQIQVSDRDVEVLVQGFKATWNRPPTSNELTSLVDDFVTEEVLVREAYKLGLDQKDGIIRNRLRQKIMFIATSVAQAAPVDEDELTKFFEENKKDFTQPGRLAFQQIYLGEKPSDAMIVETIEKLKINPELVNQGVRTLLPPAMPLSSQRAVDNVYGRGFFEGLEKLERNIWAGPVISGYGVHLVRISDRVEAKQPELQEVRQKVLAQWRAEKIEDFSTSAVAAYRNQYEIKLPDITNYPGLLKQ